jgi:hypothetical protein
MSDVWTYPGTPVRSRRWMYIAGAGALVIALTGSGAALAATRSPHGASSSGSADHPGTPLLPTRSPSPSSTAGPSSVPSPSLSEGTPGAPSGAPSETPHGAPSAVPSGAPRPPGSGPGGAPSTPPGSSATPGPTKPEQKPAATPAPAPPGPASAPQAPPAATPPPAPPAPGYTLSYVDGAGRPARWNPCATINVRLNLSNPATPPNARELVDTALSRLSTATGLQFSVVGDTTYWPAVKIGTWDADTQLMIAWADEATVPVLAGPSVVGNGNIAYNETPAGPKIYKAFAVIDVSTSGMPAGFDGPWSVGAVVLHELGHAVGLTHVDNPSHLMNPKINSKQTGDYADGDRAGLALVGAAAGCLR